MKKILAIGVLCILFMHCEDKTEEGELIICTTPGCSIPAIIRDRTAAGCYYLLELNDGTLLSPAIVGFCGTPPLPDGGIPENPLLAIKLEEGKKVLIDYSAPPVDTPSSSCADKTVLLTCVKEVPPVTEDL